MVKKNIDWQWGLCFWEWDATGIRVQARSIDLALGGASKHAPGTCKAVRWLCMSATSVTTARHASVVCAGAGIPLEWRSWVVGRDAWQVLGQQQHYQAQLQLLLTVRQQKETHPLHSMGLGVHMRTAHLTPAAVMCVPISSRYCIGWQTKLRVTLKRERRGGVELNYYQTT